MCLGQVLELLNDINIGIDEIVSVSSGGVLLDSGQQTARFWWPRSGEDTWHSASH